MHEVLANRLGGLSLPRKSVVRLTDRPDMTLDVYRGRKTTMQQQQQCNTGGKACKCSHSPHYNKPSIRDSFRSLETQFDGRNHIIAVLLSSLLLIIIQSAFDISKSMFI